MQISERFCAGFALAATIAGDRDAELAGSGLCADITPPLLTTVRALSALTKKERRERVRALLQPQRPSWPGEQSLGPAARRAYALITHAEAAQARPGYQAPPELVSVLRISALALRR